MRSLHHDATREHFMINSPTAPDYTNFPPDVLRAMAREMATKYHELAGSVPERDAPFSLARYINALACGKPLEEREHAVLEASARVLGQQFDPCRAWLPWGAMQHRVMTTAPGGKGGYMVNVTVTDPWDILRPYSVTAAAGATVMNGMRSNAELPKLGTAPTVTWIGEQPTAPAETPPTLGSVSLTERVGISLVKLSLQLVRQGPAVDGWLRAILAAAAAEAIDTAFFTGAGGVAPLGLLNASGIGTQAGASLSHAGLLAMRRQVLAAGGREEALQWVGTPQVQELLGARVRETGATGSGRFLWDDSGVLGRPAYASRTAPASALVCGDFSKAVVGLWGPGIRVDIDPSQDFNTAGVVMRVLVTCDVAFPRAEAFAVATSVS